MITEFLQEVFGLQGDEGETNGKHCIPLSLAVEKVVDETDPRLRVVPGYAGRLKEALQSAFQHITEVVEEIPGAFLCSRSSFISDPRVNAFFAGPDQLREIFSGSEEIRGLFDAAPEAQECWALLCMRKQENRHLGMALQGGELRREVMQTGVNFTDHQLLSPGASEADARSALKCCIFNSLLSYIHHRSKTAREQSEDLRNRRRVLLGRLKHHSGEEKGRELQGRLQEVERKLADRELNLDSLEAHLEFISNVLANPQRYVSWERQELRLSRLGIKLEGDSVQAGNSLFLSEIHIADHGPRIAALVRFPRAELLPHQDYLRKADLFLAI